MKNRNRRTIHLSEIVEILNTIHKEYNTNGIKKLLGIESIFDIIREKRSTNEIEKQSMKCDS